MNDLAAILRDLFVIFLLARVAAEVFERLRLPVVVGELLVGVAIGPHALGLIGMPSGSLIETFGSRASAQEGLDLVYNVVGQLGLIVLLFYVGLETNFERLLAALPRATAVAVPGTVLTMTLGTSFMLAFHHSSSESFFVGVAMVATSVAISARVMQKIGVLSTVEAQIILAAAVLDDIIGLLLLATVTGIAKEGGLDVRGLVLVAVEAVMFVAFSVLVARRLVGRYSLHLERLASEAGPSGVALALMLGMSALAAGIGLAGLVGAFLAGIALSESQEQLQLGRQVRPIYEFLAPFFFVLTGARVDLGFLRDVHLIWVTLGITGIAIAAKALGCAVGGWGMGLRSMRILGVGMLPRGEIGFAVASIGLSLGRISTGVFSSIVLMSIATALLAPPLLQHAYASRTSSKSSPSRVR
jgi:Kef-type K+ transport system membrane component KefB